MKVQSKKVVAATLAMTMCVSATAFGADTSGNASRGETVGASTGWFTTDFDIYSPTLTVSVPVDANIRVNPVADTSATSVKKFSVASNSIDIINASVDNDTAIPVNARVNAYITSKGQGVVTKYSTFTADDTSTKKKVYLALSEAGTAAQVEAASPAFDAQNKLDLGGFTLKTEAKYDSGTNSVPVTANGSLLSFNIAGPTTSDTTAGAKFSTDATKVTPAVGSFAITGVANANAAWTKEDLAVAITYNIKASRPLTVAAPTIAAVSYSMATGTDIVVEGIGEAEVWGVTFHDDALYGDYALEAGSYEVEYTTANAGTATITIPKDHSVITWFGGSYKDEAQEVAIILSNGQVPVSTFTVTD